MKSPRGLLGAGLIFWGWQTGNLWVGATLAALVEFLRFAEVRFALRPKDVARLAALTKLTFLGLAGLFTTSRGVTQAIFELFKWLPVVLTPLLLAQLLASDHGIPGNSLFRYLRRIRREGSTADDSLVDVSWLYLVLCVVGAGAANARGVGYYLGLLTVSTWALYAIRPRHARLPVSALMIAAAGALGFAGQAGLGQLQSQLETWFVEWWPRGMDADPYRSTTDIGSIGRLKQFDTIVLRVYADPVVAESVKRMHRASFTSYFGTTWRVRKAPMTALQPMADGTTWTLAPGSPASRVRIATRLEHGKALLALPPGTVRVSELPAMELKHNALGAAQAEVGGDWALYNAEFGKSIVDYALPDEEDTIIPAAERDAFVRLAAELGLQQLPVEEAIKQVTNHFAPFSYSTFRESAPPIGTTALGDFLRNSRSGHCEYFAAATTLLLRAAGIPARYATGFAMVEYSELEGAYVVRARHAHAWARAWLGDRWVDIDTTPPSWFDEEEAQAPVWQHLSDLLRWADYRWSQRGALAVGVGWYTLAALLLALLAWRSLRGKRVRCSAPAGGGAHGTGRLGADSEFFSVEEVLSARVSPRRLGETLADWTVRISVALDESERAQLHGLIALHQRYRFDPAGLAPREREALRMVALNLARELAARPASST